MHNQSGISRKIFTMSHFTRIDIHDATGQAIFAQMFTDNLLHIGVHHLLIMKALKKLKGEVGVKLYNEV